MTKNHCQCVLWIITIALFVFWEIPIHTTKQNKRRKTMKKTVVFDFDGVIHSYTSGWKREDIIPDTPVLGIKEAISEIRKAGYEVVVVSTRCATNKGIEAVNKYLFENGIVVDRVCKEKPPAIVYIDDRAICFDGKPQNLLDKINKFKPWYL